MTKSSPKSKLRPGYVKSLADLQRATGVDRGTLALWTAQPRFPKEADGSFNVWKIALWRERDFGRDVKPGQQPQRNGESMSALEREKLKIEVASRRLKLRLLAGKLVSREAVRAAVEQLFARIKARLESLPEEMTASLPPTMVHDFTNDWRHRINLILREMSSWHEYETEKPK